VRRRPVPDNGEAICLPVAGAAAAKAEQSRQNNHETPTTG